MSIQTTLIMHRLHEDDLAGHVQAQERWEVVCYPAIAEEDETHLIETPLETRLVTRSCGAALHPEREPLDMLEQIRRTIGEYNFARQYQRAPAPHGGEGKLILCPILPSRVPSQ